MPPGKRFLPFKVTNVVEYNHDTNLLQLSIKPTDLPTLQEESVGVGAAFHFSLRVELEDRTATRPYTPVSFDVREGTMELLIMRYADGAVTPVIHDQLG